MLDMCLVLLSLNLAATVALLCCAGFAMYRYIRLSQRLSNTVQTITMNCEELLEQLMGEDQETSDAPPCSNTAHRNPSEQEQRKARLAALVAGGNSKQYTGKQLTLSQIDDMSDDELDSLYSRYEARLGAMMTKSLGNSALRLYAMAASMLLPLPQVKQPQLVADLEGDPFVNHALTTACCELYHRYGSYLAPVTAALTTMKHCEFRQEELSTIDDGRYRESDTDTEGP